MADVKNWLGKAVGGMVGFLAGGPMGAALGVAVGHQYDLSNMGSFESKFEPDDSDEIRTAFFEATFSVMGHLAKLDGLVTKAEIEAAKSIMDRMELSTEMRQKAIGLYTEGKAVDFPLDEILANFYAISRHRYALIRLFIDIQLEAAFAEGFLYSIQEIVLLKICDKIKFSRFEYHMLKAARDHKAKPFKTREQSQKIVPPEKQMTLKEAYAALNLTSNASPAEIRQSYRRMISQHHPDKLVAAGKSAADIRNANEKTQQIRKAYEMISKLRNLKRG